MDRLLWSRALVAKLKPTHYKKLLLAVVGIIVVSFTLLALFTLVPFSNESGSTSIVPIDEIEPQAVRVSEESGTEGALRFYDEQVEVRKAREEKQLVLIMKSRFAQGTGETDVAVDAAKRADGMGSSARTLAALAEAYLAKGDKKQALVYYKRLQETSPQLEDSNRSPRRGLSLEDKIRELEK